MGPTATKLCLSRPRAMIGRGSHDDARGRPQRADRFNQFRYDLLVAQDRFLPCFLYQVLLLDENEHRWGLVSGTYYTPVPRPVPFRPDLDLIPSPNGMIHTDWWRGFAT